MLCAKVLWPYDAKVLSKKNDNLFDNLFMTAAAGTVALNIIYEGQFKTRVQKPWTIYEKLAEIDTLFMTKTAKNPYPLGPHIPI